MLVKQSDNKDVNISSDTPLFVSPLTRPNPEPEDPVTPMDDEEEEVDSMLSTEAVATMSMPVGSDYVPSPTSYRPITEPGDCVTPIDDGPQPGATMHESVAVDACDDDWIFPEFESVAVMSGSDNKEDPDDITITCRCPVCKEEHDLSAGGIDQLQDDAHILEKLEQMSIKKTLSAKQFKCILCVSDKVLEYCENCSGFLCDFCVTAHKRQSTYDNHRSVPCDDLSPEQYVVSSVREITCGEHKKEVVFYCSDCDLLLCPKCLSGNHKVHDFSTIEESDQNLVDKARKVTDLSTRVLAKFRGHKDYLLRVEKEILTSAHYDKLKTDINQQFDELIQCLQKKRQELLGIVDEHSNTSKKKVWGEKEFVEHRITAIEGGVQFAEKARSVHNPTERIRMNSQVISRLSGLVSDEIWTPATIKPPLVLKCAKSNTLSVPDLSALEDTDISLEYDELPKICQDVSLTVKFAAPLPSDPHIQILYGKSQQILDESVVAVWCESEEERNCYCLRFVPRVSGKHLMEVSVAGVSVVKKDFDVSGQPRYGNKVQPGPDWPCQSTISDWGTVTSLGKGYSRTTSVTVTWEDENSTQCEYDWPGSEGSFEIELIPSINQL